MNENIKRLEIQGKTLYLIGTAHVSSVSAEEVKACIEEVHPQSVCIELDQERYASFTHPKQWEETDLTSVIKEGKSGYMLVNLILSSYQKRIAKKIEAKQGGEMTQAIESAKACNAQLVLCDRNIQTTFKRIYRKHSFFQKIKLFSSLIGSIFDDDDLTEQDIEDLKNQDTLEAALATVSKQFPVVAEVLIHERDVILAQKIKHVPGPVVVAVLGAAHIPGVTQALSTDVDITELETVPPKSLFSRILKWAIPLLLITMILVLFFTNSHLGWAQLLNWILWNGSLSALGTLLAGGSILAILTAFVASPITSLNPLLAAGWFAGLVEAWVKKPKVKDFESITEDCGTFKGFYRNRITHVLLVVVLANLFSTLGTFIGGADVVVHFFEAIF